MKDVIKIGCGILLGMLLVLATCIFGSIPVVNWLMIPPSTGVPTLPLTPTGTPIATPTLQPTPTMELEVIGYEVTYSCPNASKFHFVPEPPKGAKFIVIKAFTRNPIEAELEDSIGYISWSLQRGDKMIAEYDTSRCNYGDSDETWTRLCSGKTLYPGVSCEGWMVFEVPEALEAEGVEVVAKWGEGRKSWGLSEGD